MLFPIDNAAARSLVLVLTFLVAACGSDDDDSGGADTGVQIADDPSDAVPDDGGSDAGGTDAGADGGEEDVTTDTGGTDAGADTGGTDAEADTGGTDAEADTGGTDADGSDDGTNVGGADVGTDTAGTDGGTDTGEADASPPDVAGGRPSVSIFPFDPAEGVPVIDGSFDEAWNGATFSDETGESLLIDRLLIDRGAEAADGGVPYTWFAMHDFESLYLFVQFERSAPYTPFRDSERFFDDDALNLFFDGDASRGERLEGTDGADDRYLAIPLLAREGEERPEAFAPLRELAPEVPPSLEYGVCLCEGSATGWELKIALSDLNIEVGRPFGFEVQLDQDLDGGERDSRWGWSNPAPAMGGAFVPESPVLSGTVTLQP